MWLVCLLFSLLIGGETPLNPPFGLTTQFLLFSPILNSLPPNSFCLLHQLYFLLIWDNGKLTKGKAFRQYLLQRWLVLGAMQHCPTHEVSIKYFHYWDEVFQELIMKKVDIEWKIKNNGIQIVKKINTSRLFLLEKSIPLRYISFPQRSSKLCAL